MLCCKNQNVYISTTVGGYSGLTYTAMILSSKSRFKYAIGIMLCVAFFISWNAMIKPYLSQGAMIAPIFRQQSPPAESRSKPLELSHKTHALDLSPKLNLSSKTDLLPSIKELELQHEHDEIIVGSMEQKQGSEPLITLFTTFKEDQGRIPLHSFVVKNWASLKPYVQPVLFTTQASGILVDLASEHDWDILPSPGVNEVGTPFVKAMYVTAFEKYNTPLFAYSNGDLLYSNDFIDTLKGLVEHFVQPPVPPNAPFVIARRCNIQLDGSQPVDLWKPDTVKKVAKVTQLHRVDAFDIFMTTKWGFPMQRIPDIVVGRGGIGQFLYVAAEHFNLTTVDTSTTNRILHLQGKGIMMTHKSDKNPDASFNMNILSREFGPIPFAACVTSATAAYTEYKPITKRVEVKNRNKPRISSRPSVINLKFKTQYADSYVIKSNVSDMFLRRSITN